MNAPEFALTLRPIWAWAIVHAGKRIENRTWPTKHRGPIYIHAGYKNPQPEERISLAQRLKALGLAYPPESEFPRGGLVAIATLVDCVQLPRSRLGAWGIEGCWHFLLEDVRPLAEPVPMGGKLGFWRV